MCDYVVHYHLETITLFSVTNAIWKVINRVSAAGAANVLHPYIQSTQTHSIPIFKVRKRTPSLYSKYANALHPYIQSTQTHFIPIFKVHKRTSSLYSKYTNALHPYIQSTRERIYLIFHFTRQISKESNFHSALISKDR